MSLMTKLRPLVGWVTNMTAIIERAIKQHGAKKVYDAAYGSMAGNIRPLLDCGLSINSIADAEAIGRIAYKHLTATEKASDYWDASKQ